MTAQELEITYWVVEYDDGSKRVMFDPPVECPPDALVSAEALL